MNRRNFLTYTALLGGSALLESNTLAPRLNKPFNSKRNGKSIGKEDEADVISSM